MEREARDPKKGRWVRKGGDLGEVTRGREVGKCYLFIPSVDKAQSQKCPQVL